MCQLAWDLISDHYDQSQTTDLNKSPTRYHSTTALTAFCCLQFSMYLAMQERVWSAVAQLVECRTRNRESPVVTVSRFGHFLSLHDASVDSAV